MPLNLIPPDYPRTIAAEAARREDARLVAVVQHYAGRVCPFPVTVYAEESPAHPYGDLVVRAGSVVLARISELDHYAELPDHSTAKAARLGIRAAATYLALEPLEHDHPLGQD